MLLAHIYIPYVGLERREMAKLRSEQCNVFCMERAMFLGIERHIV